MSLSGLSGLSGLSAIAGSGGGGPAADSVYAFLNLAGTAGIITPTILNNCMLGAVKGTWSYGGGKHNNVDVDPVTVFNVTGLRSQTSYDLTPPISCDGTVVSSVDRAMEWDESLAVNAADWETAKWVPGETLTGNLMLDYRFEMNRTLGGDVGGTGIDVSSIYFGGDFSILQQQISAGGAITMRPHGGQNMTIANNVRYRIRHLARRLSNFTYILITNDATGAFVSSSRNTLTVSDNVSLVLMGNYLLNGNGTHRISAWTPKPGAAAVLPTVDIGTVTSLSATQTDVGEVTLTGLTQATSLLIERNASGGAYSTIEASYNIADRANASDPFSYVDTSRTDGVLYGYRTTPQVDTITGTAATDSVTIDDAPFADPTWTDAVDIASTTSDDSNGGTVSIGQLVTCGTTGNCTRIRVGCRTNIGTGNIKVAIYSAAGSLLGQGAATSQSPGSGTWAEILLDAPIAVTASTQYRLAFSTNSVTWGIFGYVSTGTAAEDFGTVYADFPPSPWAQSDATSRTYAIGMGVIPS